MNPEEMMESLTKQLEELTAELLELEKEFNFKKEQYFRVHGAIEALQQVKL